MVQLLYLSASVLGSDSANSVHVMKMCQAYTAIGHNVTLHGLRGSGKTDSDVHFYYGIVHPFTLKRWTESETPLVRWLWQLRHRWSWLKVGIIPSLLFGRLTIRAVLRKAQPDLILARHIYWLAGAGPDGSAFILESHHPPRGRLDTWLQGRLLKKKGFRCLVVISDPLKKMYLQVFPWLDAASVVVAHDGADDPGPDVSNVDQPEEQRLSVGYVGHLYKGRGAGLIRELAQLTPEADFHLIGGRVEDIQVLEQKGCPENLQFHGHQPHARMPEYYRSFDVVLAPYQKKVAVSGNAGDTSAFMSPLKIFEYMSFGLPILCSDLPVLRGVLEDDRTAILLPPDEPKAWADALRELAADPERRRRLGGAARERFLKAYTWRARAKEILAAAGLSSTGHDG